MTAAVQVKRAARIENEAHTLVKGGGEESREVRRVKKKGEGNGEERGQSGGERSGARWIYGSGSEPEQNV